jgi:small subunit ribosomal protein S4
MGLGKGSLKYWAIMERWLFKHACIARRMKRSIGQVFLQSLEMHLDNVIFWLGMATQSWVK